MVTPKTLSKWERVPVLWPMFVFITASAVGYFLSPYKGLATVAYLFLAIGLFHRHKRIVHVRLMSLGIILDVSLVLTLEFQRSAIGTVVGGHLNAFQVSHVLCSTLAVVFYIPVSILGYRRFRDELQSRGKDAHMRLGIAAFVLRT